ncbi:hypothetical protein BVRB_028320 [Beta vulgaris subsp. vulgaris]|uniref:DNA mismatch repair protein MutS core domain-containing protein n=1 Tax=Beta vulgaris subsp. vulgaris TaxID=3555 RepID=A0A0J8B1J5_BETVV|nr:hypothetical protein BVRB_028320 [Beta vulgaris subsp. vulgaris]
MPSIFGDMGQLAVAAFGQVVQYLKRCLLDEELVKIGTFVQYDPNDSDTNSFLALDGQTIANLEIVQNSEGGLQGSLLEYIDHCVTPFGHRRLREWIIRPLVRPHDINERLDAVENLIQDIDTRSECFAS